MLQRLQIASVVALLSLLALIVVSEIWVLGVPVSRISLILAVLPLLLALRGFLHGKRYTFQWMSLIIWLYFTAGVVRAWAAANYPAQIYGTLEILLSLTLFALCCAYARCSVPLRQK